jgi:large subunit ribosomal protein L18
MSATLPKRRTGVAERRAVGRARRHFRVRKNVSGTPQRPRLVVTRSLRNITAQVVDDTVGHTMVSASSLDVTIRGAAVRGAATAGATGTATDSPATGGGKKAVAAQVGTLIGERAKAAGINKVVFDRGGNQYAGRVAALAGAAREAGLEF